MAKAVVDSFSKQMLALEMGASLGRQPTEQRHAKVIALEKRIFGQEDSGSLKCLMHKNLAVC